jgi:hypothetical protein
MVESSRTSSRRLIAVEVILECRFRRNYQSIVSIILPQRVTVRILSIADFVVREALDLWQPDIGGMGRLGEPVEAVVGVSVGTVAVGHAGDVEHLVVGVGELLDQLAGALGDGDGLDGTIGAVDVRGGDAVRVVDGLALVLA